MVCIMKIQVNKNHYNFSRYMKKKRWCSIWHQLDEVLGLEPEKVLEIGPGLGLFKSVASVFGLRIDTLDIADDLKPDILASATDIPLADKSYDVVCSFQMLEHIPFDMTIDALKEMARVSKKYIVISLPDAEKRWPYSFFIPNVGIKSFSIKKPFHKIKENKFNGQHYWEINKKGYELEVIKKKFLDTLVGFELIKTYRVPENLYHRFFIFVRK